MDKTNKFYVEIYDYLKEKKVKDIDAIIKTYCNIWFLNEPNQDVLDVIKEDY